MNLPSRYCADGEHKHAKGNNYKARIRCAYFDFCGAKAARTAGFIIPTFGSRHLVCDHQKSGNNKHGTYDAWTICEGHI
jgi:hypothetical protein